MGYEQAFYHWKNEYFRLKRRSEIIQEQKNQALLLRERLLLQINSQSDPEWIELVLMQGLGLVPEGQTKAYFSNTKGGSKNK
jgi:hypothetical protein